MKRIGLLLFLCLIISLPCKSSPIPIDTVMKDNRIVFVYHIPDEVSEETETQESNEVITEDIISDDVTADTSGIAASEDDNLYDDENYLISDMYKDVLKGYASYDEEYDSKDKIELDPDYGVLTININNPVKINAKKYSSLQSTESLYDNIYTKFNGSEYIIAPISNKHSKDFGSGLSSGTIYEQEISYGELEQSSSIFSRYEYKHFALTTSYTKTINTTNNNYNDKFAITPELKLGQYLTLKNKLSADTVKKRKKAELILSINPFGKRDLDRLKFDFTVGETYDEISNSFWNRFEFNTTFKL